MSKQVLRRVKLWTCTRSTSPLCKTLASLAPASTAATNEREREGGGGSPPSVVFGSLNSKWLSQVQALFHSLRSAYAAAPTNLKIIDLYVVYAITTAVIQVVYMGIVGSFPFNSFLAGVLSCVGTAVLAVCLRIQVNKENKEFKDLPPERAFADFLLCNLALHLAVTNFLG